MTEKAELIERLREIEEWHRTGILTGNALRSYAKEKFGSIPVDAGERLTIAERETHREASRVIINGRFISADAIEAEQCAVVSDERGYCGDTVGKRAVGHLREMYRKAFDALGSSGRVSLRNFIDNRIDDLIAEAKAEAIEAAKAVAHAKASEARDKMNYYRPSPQSAKWASTCARYEVMADNIDALHTDATRAALKRKGGE